MAQFEHTELKEMVDRWLEANRLAQVAGDWRGMAELFTVDATYGWNMGPHEDFMAVGRDEIREDRPRDGDGRSRWLDLPLPEGADRRASGRGDRLVEAGGRCQAP